MFPLESTRNSGFLKLFLKPPSGPSKSPGDSCAFQRNSRFFPRNRLVARTSHQATQLSSPSF